MVPRLSTYYPSFNMGTYRHIFIFGSTILSPENAIQSLVGHAKAMYYGILDILCLAMPNPCRLHCQVLSSCIGFESLGWTYLETWFRGTIGFIGMIAICSTSPNHVLIQIVMFIKSICILQPQYIVHVLSCTKHQNVSEFPKRVRLETSPPKKWKHRPKCQICI